jgi:hypothetical protein
MTIVSHNRWFWLSSSLMHVGKLLIYLLGLPNWLHQRVALLKRWNKGYYKWCKGNYRSISRVFVPNGQCQRRKVRMFYLREVSLSQRTQTCPISKSQKGLILLQNKPDECNSLSFRSINSNGTQWLEIVIKISCQGPSNTEKIELLLYWSLK